MDKKTRQGFFNGVIATIGGVMLAVNVQPRAFMSVKTHSSPRSETSYAVQENILRQIGLLFLVFGLLLTCWFIESIFVKIAMVINAISSCPRVCTSYY